MYDFIFVYDERDCIYKEHPVMKRVIVKNDIDTSYNLVFLPRKNYQDVWTTNIFSKIHVHFDE